MHACMRACIHGDCVYCSLYHRGYFRFGRLSWKQTEIKSDGIVVQFTLKTAWSRAYFARGPSDEPEGNCVECQVEAKNPARECDNFPAGHKVVQSACILPVPGDRVALYDAVDTGNLDDNVLGGALPPVETSFAFGDDPSSTRHRPSFLIRRTSRQSRAGHLSLDFTALTPRIARSNTK